MSYLRIAYNDDVLVAHSIIHKFIKHAYNKYLCISTDIESFFDSTNNNIKFVCHMTLESYLHSRILQSDYKKLVEDMLHSINKFFKCDTIYRYSEYQSDGNNGALCIYIKLNKDIFNTKNNGEYYE